MNYIAMKSTIIWIIVIFYSIITKLNAAYPYEWINLKKFIKVLHWCTCAVPYSQTGENHEKMGIKNFYIISLVTGTQIYWNEPVVLELKNSKIQHE